MLDLIVPCLHGLPAEHRFRDVAAHTEALAVGPLDDDLDEIGREPVVDLDLHGGPRTADPTAA
jgi:hypothetical protein